MGKWIFCTDAEWAGEITQAQYPQGNYQEDEFALWEADADGDLAGVDTVVHFYKTIDWGTDSADLLGFAAKDAGKYIEFANSFDGDKHDGTVDGAGDTLISGATGGDVLRFRTGNIKIHDLRYIMDGTDDSDQAYYTGAAGEVLIYNNVIKRTSASDGPSITVAPTGSLTTKIYNNFIINLGTGAWYALMFNDAEADNNLIINNSIYAPNMRGFAPLATNTNKMRNNLNFAGSVWYLADEGNASYEGVPCSDGAASDPDGAGCVYDLEAAKLVFDLTAGTEDLRLNPAGDDFALIDTEGIGPDSDGDVPAADILGTARTGNTCSIGAFEYDAGGGPTFIPRREIGAGVGRGIWR